MSVKVSKTLLLLALVMRVSAQTVFINTGSVWKYSTGIDLGTIWKEPAYNDSLWQQGASQLGYGDGDEATAILSSPINPTYYFRHTFSIANPTSFQAFVMNVKRDDGIIIYVNGAEVFRDNMSTGGIGYSTWALTSAADDGAIWIAAVLSPISFTSGINVIAAEVHQSGATSSDISFDLQLTGGTVPVVTVSRGPYLQLATSESVFLKWRTSIRTDTKVRYGMAPGNLNYQVADLFSTTDHTLQLTGLAPATKYYYAIGMESQNLQGDSANYFITAPIIGTEKTTRIWVTGDCGTGQAVQTVVRMAYENFVGANYTDLWLLLGDNAYENGLDSEYQSRFFQPYMAGKVMRQTVLFPAPGNHDYANSASLLENRSTPYFQNFILPTAAEAGGVASGTEMYYSFNYANIHFISLDSYGTENNKKMYDTTSAQIQWLKQDLAANTQKWTILYWHHPPYTKGSHNSDTENDLEDIREKVISLIDRYKVDLILCGHSHSYERSKIMKGHYGLENTFSTAVHTADSSSGLYDGSVNSCPYIKSSEAEENEGIVYVVAGSAGKLGGTTSGYPHDAMYYSNTSTGGSLYIEVDGNRLDARWIAANGSVLDKFTIMKDVNKAPGITVTEGDTASLAASWKGIYQWNQGGATSQSIQVTPTDTSTYIVTDGTLNCLRDSFKVDVIPVVNISGYILSEKDTPIIGVTVKLTGDEEKETVTGIDGFYSFNVPKGGSYFITPLKNNDAILLNGISTIDLGLTQRHILNSDTLDSPYKIIAADVNGTETVTTIDIANTQSLILGNATAFPAGKLWEFVPEDFIFTDVLHPFPFMKSRDYSNIASDQTQQNFIGIRLADVNNSWNSGAH